jgi:hypothetical protein
MNDLTKQFKTALEPQEYELDRGGPVVKLKRVGLMDLIQQGNIPDNLSGQTAQILGRPNLAAMTQEDLKQYAELVNVVVMASVVEPRITPDGAGDSIKVDDIPFAWRVKIFQHANQSVFPLRRILEKKD